MDLMSNKYCRILKTVTLEDRGANPKVTFS